MAGWETQLRAWILSACLLEASARKPGNVHPQASFADLTYADFVTSAVASAPILARSREIGVGPAIEQAARATHEQTGANTNLGILLLVTPLAAVPEEQTLRAGIREVLDSLSLHDAECVYRAIKCVDPGGMGKAEAGDVSDGPTGTLLEMMRLAVDRDRIAAEYANEFSVTLEFGRSYLAKIQDFEECWDDAITALHLELMANFPDTLIERKCGPAVAQESAHRARDVLNAKGRFRRSAIQDFDQWLRADGHQRNPGTTADLVAASLFAAIRDDGLPVPNLKVCVSQK